MALYMDVHNSLPDGATAADIAGAHAADLQVQERYGVRYLSYWVDEKGGKVFCLVEAPNADAAHAVITRPSATNASFVQKKSDGPRLSASAMNSIVPVTAFSAKAAHTMPNSRSMDCSGIPPPKPSSRRSIIKAAPTNTIIPKV